MHKDTTVLSFNQGYHEIYWIYLLQSYYAHFVCKGNKYTLRLSYLEEFCHWPIHLRIFQFSLSLSCSISASQIKGCAYCKRQLLGVSPASLPPLTHSRNSIPSSRQNVCFWQVWASCKHYSLWLTPWKITRQNNLIPYVF